MLSLTRESVASEASGPRCSPAYRFAVFELDADREELRRSGVLVKLPAQPFKILVLLLERAGDVVTRDEIREHIWGADTYVDYEGGINAAVRQIRAALDDSASAPRFVETVPRRGYRFVAPVEWVEPMESVAAEADPVAAEAAPAVGAGPAPADAPRRRPHPAWWLAPVILAIALLVVLPPLLTGPPGEPESPAPAAGSDLRLVVLPFEDLSPAAAPGFQSALGLSLTEELISELSRRTELGVIARTSAMSFRGSGKSAAQIADELDVSHILEGSVRRQGDRLRVTAQLIRAEDEEHVWANTYDRRIGDLLDLEREVSEAIARALDLQLAVGTPGSEPTPSGTIPNAAGRDRAMLHYLEGMEQRQRVIFGLDEPSSPEGPGGARLALAQFERALEADPALAPAWVELAAFHMVLPPAEEHLPLAHEALETALALDERIPRAHQILAIYRFYHEWDFDGARESWERALALSPRNAEIHHWYAGWFAAHGRFDEALAHVERARELDPIAPAVLADDGWYAYFAGRHEQAIAAAERTLEIDPRYFWGRRLILLVAPLTDHPERAWNLAGELLEELGLDPGAEPGPETLERYWRSRIDPDRQDPEILRSQEVARATAHMALGQHDEALAELEAAYRLRHGWVLPFLRVHPLFRPLQGEPRFEELVRQVGVPEPAGSA